MWFSQIPHVRIEPGSFGSGVVDPTLRQVSELNTTNDFFLTQFELKHLATWQAFKQHYNRQKVRKIIRTANLRIPVTQNFENFTGTLVKQMKAHYQLWKVWARNHTATLQLLVLRGDANCIVSFAIDNGATQKATWQSAKSMRDNSHCNVANKSWRTVSKFCCFFLEK